MDMDTVQKICQFITRPWLFQVTVRSLACVPSLAKLTTLAFIVNQSNFSFVDKNYL